MPIYEYACDSCETTFERKQKFSDEPVKICPECGSDVRRVLYPAGIIFKGSGWYATDNRSSTNAGSTTSPSNGSSSNGSDSGGSTSKESSTKEASSKSSTSESSSTAADN